jgi:restriction system protein
MLSQYWLFLIPIAFLVGYLFRKHQIYRFQNRGEELLRKAITKNLPATSWHLLNNVTLPITSGTTQIDHILVSRYGVFVIETKDYDGWIFGASKSKRWMQITRSGKYSFQNPVHQNYRHLKAVQSLLDFLPPEQINSLVVFTGNADFKTIRPLGVYSLGSVMEHLTSFKEELITENRMQLCVGRLECKRLALTKETDVEHVENLNKN